MSCAILCAAAEDARVAAEIEAATAPAALSLDAPTAAKASTIKRWSPSGSAAAPAEPTTAATGHPWEMR